MSNEKKKPIISPEDFQIRMLDLFDSIVRQETTPSEGKAAVSAANTYLNIVKLQMSVARHNSVYDSKINF